MDKFNVLERLNTGLLTFFDYHFVKPDYHLIGLPPPSVWFREVLLYGYIS
jgi:hypothetical protein